MAEGASFVLTVNGGSSPMPGMTDTASRTVASRLAVPGGRKSQVMFASDSEEQTEAGGRNRLRTSQMSDASFSGRPRQSSSMTPGNSMGMSSSTASTKPRRRQSLVQGADFEFCPNLTDLRDASDITVAQNLEKLWIMSALPTLDEGAENDEASGVKESTPLQNKNPIYCQVGWGADSMLIAVNPNDEKLGRYDAQLAEAYRSLGRRDELSQALPTLGPHCFALAEAAFQGLLERGAVPQSLVCLGESGSGKTWNCTKMRNYLLDMFCPDKDDRRRLKSCADLLIHFGNASTMYCDHATRYSSYMRLYFAPSSVEGQPLQVIGAKLEHFMLESTRFSFLPDRERNFHVVHYLAVANPGVTFKYLEEAGDRTVNHGHFKTPKDFASKLKDQMVKCGFSKAEVDASLNLILGLMYCGNVEFVPATVPKFDTGGDKVEGCAICPESEEAFKQVVQLLGLGKNELTMIFTRRPCKRGIETVWMALTAKQASENVNLIVRELYARLFDFVVGKVNEQLAGGNKFNDKLCIGLLDVAGFADRRRNYFEQLLMNTANEMLQQLFLQTVQKEVDIREAEGIEVHLTSPLEDNSMLVSLLADFTRKPGGIVRQYDDFDDKLSPIDFANGQLCGDESTKQWKKANESQYFIKTVEFNEKEPLAQAKQAQLKKIQDGNEKFRTAILNDLGCFAVRHTMGDVLYINRDFAESGQRSAFAGQQMKILDLLKSTRNTVLQTLVQTYAKTDTKQRGAALLGDWKTMIDKTLAPSKCHFVHCIRPNTKGHHKYFDDDELLRQVKTCGVAPLVALQQAFPESMKFVDFVNEFWCLERGGNMPHAVNRNATTEPRKRSEDLLTMFLPGSPPLFKVGSSLLFFQHGALERLRALRQVFEKRFKFVVRRKWWASHGVGYAALVLKMEEDLNAFRRDLEEYKLHEQPEVAQALAEADRKMLEAQVPKDSWKRVAEAWKAANGGVLPPEVEADLRAVKAEARPDGYFGFVEELGELSGRLRRNVEDGREHDKQLIEAEIAKRKVRIVELMEHVGEIQDDVAGQERKEEVKIQEGCVDSIVLLEQGQKKLDLICNDAKLKCDAIFDPTAIPERKLWWKFPPEVDQAIETSVGTCETNVFSLVENLKERTRAFREAMTNDASMKELMDLTLDAKARLDWLQDPSNEEAKTLRLEKISNPGEEDTFEERGSWIFVRACLNDALALHDDIEEEFELGLNPDLYREAMERFLAEEKAVQERVEGVRREIIEKEQEFLDELRRLFGDFDKAQEFGELYRRFMQNVEALSIFVQDHPVGPSHDVDELSQGEFLAVLSKIKDNVYELHLEVLGDDDVGEGLTVSRTGPWSAERFRLLGAQVEDYENLAPVLDEDDFFKLLNTVDALNSGVVRCSDGFCIAWSETWQQYYMLYTQEAAERALAALESTQGQMKVRSKEKRTAALRRALGHAVHELDVQKARDRLDQSQEDLRRKCKTEVMTELAERYSVEAQTKIEANSTELCNWGSEEMAKIHEKRQAIQVELDALEQQYYGTIFALTKRLRRAQIRMGCEGAYPSLYAQLLEAWRELTRLSDFAQKLLDHSTAEVEDLWKATGLTEQLTARPGSYSGLRDLVQVLTVCQDRHAETEALVLELAVSSSFLGMREARAMLTEVALRIKRICDGSVKKRSGLEEEWQGISALLSGLRAHFNRMIEMHKVWHVRFTTARHFVEQAMGLVDVRLDAIEEAKDGELRSKRGSLVDIFAEGSAASFRKPGGDSRASTPTRNRNAIESMLEGIKGPLSPRRGKVDFQLEIGHRVVDLYTKQLYGTVVYMGEVSFASGIWAGVRLDTPKGHNDGTVRGKEYFKCAPGHGLFIRPSQLDRVFEHCGHKDCCKPCIVPYGLERDVHGPISPCGSQGRPGCSNSGSSPLSPRSPRSPRNARSPRGSRDIFEIAREHAVCP